MAALPIPQGLVAPAAGIAGVLPRGAWFGAPNNGPRYILCRENLVNIRSHAICIVTGGSMLNNRQASIRNRFEWTRRSDHGTPGLGNPVAVRIAQLLPLPVGAVMSAAGDAAQKTALPTHRIKILVNIAEFDPTARGATAGSPQHLRTCIQAVLDAYMLLPVAHPPGGVHPLLTYQLRGPEIAFDLCGSGIVGYGAERAAENVLAAIQGWFNDPVTGAARRAAITTVFLSVPVTKSQDPETIESAWWRACRYVRPRTNYVINDRHVPWIEEMEDQEIDLHAASPGEIESLPGKDGRLCQGVGVVAGSVGIVLQ